jgi:hypothetical protein
MTLAREGECDVFSKGHNRPWPRGTNFHTIEVVSKSNSMRTEQLEPGSPTLKYSSIHDGAICLPN